MDKATPKPTKTYLRWLLDMVLFSLFLYMILNFLNGLFGGGAADSQELKALIEAGAAIVDVRTPQEFAGGHAKGAVNIPLNELSTRWKSLKNKSNIILVCRSGGRAEQAKQFLNQQGLQNVHNAGAWQNVERLQ